MPDGLRYRAGRSVSGASVIYQIGADGFDRVVGEFITPELAADAAAALNSSADLFDGAQWPGDEADRSVTPPTVVENSRLAADIAAHPRGHVIEALADAMHGIEDDGGTGRHISYYRSLAYATVEVLPALGYDEDALCDEQGCGAHPPSG